MTSRRLGSALRAAAAAGRVTPSVRSRLRSAIRVGFGLALGALLWSLLVEPCRLVVHPVDLALPRWTGGPLRVALLSDLHVGSPSWGLDHLRDLVHVVNAEEPDVVLLAGDYVIDNVLFGRKVDQESIGEVLGGLRAPHGVVAVLGNHDWWNDGDRMRRALEANGIVVLENEVHAFDHRGGAIAIAGLADAMTRRPDPRATYALAREDAALLALVHEPDVFVDVGDRPALTLAGHTHGGQVALPLLGRPVVPSSYGQRFAAGHVVEAGRHLFVTTGVGTSILPIRFGVAPEIVILTVHGSAGGGR